MKRLLVATALLVASSAQAESTPFVSSFFTDKCAVLNDNLREYGDDWESFTDAMLTGFINGVSISLYGTDADSYIPSSENMGMVYRQIVYNSCENNPEKLVLEMAMVSLKRVTEKREK